MRDPQTALLTQAIASLRSPGFTGSLVALLRDLVDFDGAVIIGHRPGQAPIYLHDALPRQRELLFQRYLMQAWQGDPFLVALDSHRREGLFRLADALEATEGRSDPEYMKAFYQQTGWRDELCLAVCLDAARWVVIYLGRLAPGHAFSAEAYQRLHERFDLLAALCRQHWASDPLTLSPPTTGEDDAGALLSRALECFGEGLLTPRERQVATLMVQGLTPEEIAERLAITPGTARNHRKRLYARLGIGSRGELFRRFLNHAITLAAQARKDDPENAPFRDIVPVPGKR
ncbi:helix-turn-helix transcriptional regulator [Halomonas sp. 328]|uniref:helix-turn-helix transcriptional regulator n=1 Tax=Halomonas sp. 328 TaxID=2776704 RepID=UPI0018A6FDFD|nr:helix-turn-helix transcriptional regulator [Halomonas sp. 328]MBF8222549.1 helix-turn-helix transcriptional regulator [Halomonas sp. 328]